ncbi:MAG: hypothetical protein HQL30_06425 [Candidatus Omnitrophica bacterium]|nr:hypothetical protein [Candidatus Omnitrophota bacterium]
MRSTLFCLFLSALLFSVPVDAEEIIKLDDGTGMRGNIIAWSSGKTSFYFKPANKKSKPRWVSMSHVKSIEYEGVPVRNNQGLTIRPHIYTKK